MNIRANRILIAVFGVAFVLLIVEWLLFGPGELFLPTPPPGIPEEVAWQPPDRTPDVFGTIVAIKFLDRPRLLIRPTKPNQAGWDSATNQSLRKQNTDCWVIIREGESVRDRQGETNTPAVGQTVSAWGDAFGMMMSRPPQMQAMAVVIEPDDK